MPAKSKKPAADRPPPEVHPDPAGAQDKFEPLRWTLERAASEFGLNPRTVAQRVKTSGILPGQDRKFSTADIHAAICGDYERERTRKMTEDADSKAIQNAQARQELLDKPDFLKRLEPIYLAAREKIMSSSMTDADKDALLGELAKVHSL